MERSQAVTNSHKQSQGAVGAGCLSHKQPQEEWRLKDFPFPTSLKVPQGLGITKHKKIVGPQYLDTLSLRGFVAPRFSRKRQQNGFTIRTRHEQHVD